MTCGLYGPFPAKSQKRETNMLARICALMFGLLLSACGGGGGEAGTALLGGATSTLFTSAPAAVTIDIGRAAEYSIAGGKPPYSVSSSDISAVTAGLQGSAGFMISGVKGGTATVTVKDSAGAAVALAVTVGSGTALFTSAPAQVTLAVGAVETFNIGGGAGPFSVASANGTTATAVLNASGAAFTLSGQKSGVTTVVVSDSRGATVSINVTVGSGQSSVPLFTSAANPVVVGVGTAPVYSIGGGSGPYLVTSSNDAVAKPVVTGNSFSISGLAPGAASILISDTVGGRVSLSVTVGSADVVALYTTAPANLVLSKGASPQVFSIGGGVGPYTASSGNSTTVSATVSGARLSLEGLGLGSTTVSVFDSQGRTTPINVTVNALSPLNVSAPELLTLAPGATGTYQISGGLAPYEVIVSNPAVVSASSSGSSFSLGALIPGAAQVTVRDSTGAQKLVAVTVTPSQALFISSAPTVSLPSGTAATFVVGGGVPAYAVSSSNTAVVTASLSGTTLTLNALSTGTATVVVRDAAGATQSVAVSAAPALALFTTAPAAVTVAPTSTQTYSVGGGVGPYTATSSNAAVATASVTGSTLTINGVASGATTVSIRDALGVSVTASVTVSTAAIQALTVSPTTVAAAVGDRVTFTMFGGDPAYAVVLTNTSVASLASQGSNRFVLDLLRAGATSVVVSDARGQVQTVNVTIVPAAVLPLALNVPSPVNLTLGADRSAFVSGGVAPYSVGSGNEAVVRASISGGTVTLTPVANGSAVVQLSDSAGSNRSLTVTVGSSTPLFTTAPSALTVVPGTSQTFTISGGTSPYFAESGSRAAVTASAAGSVLTITGVTPGSSTVAVRDSLGATVAITVTVGGQTPLFSSAPATAVMSAGTAQTFVVGGGSPKFAAANPVYEVSSSDTGVVTVSVEGTSLTVTAVAGGTAVVTIADALGARTSFNVTVGAAAALYTTAPSAVTLAPGAVNSQTYEIRGGAAPYVAASSNVAVASVAVTGSSLTITGVMAGTSNIVVTDRLGRSVSITVTVTAAAAQPMTVTPLAASGSVGDILRFEIRGGSPVYTVTVNNQNIASATAPGSATAFNLTLTAAGATSVAVIDANGQVQNIPITAQASVGTPLFTSAPPTASLAVGVPRTFVVGGGSGSYSFASSDANVVAVPAGSSTSLVVTPLAQGTATVTITDTVGARASFVVTVGAVQPLVLSAGPAVTLAVAGGPTTYAISGGRSPYTAVSTNASVVTVAPPGATSGLILTPVAAGTASVIVTDALGVQVAMAITVAQAGVVNMAVSPAALTANVGEELVLTITGGSSPYTVNASNPAVVDRLTASPAGSPARFRVLNAGATTITVLDSAGQVQQVAVTATQAATQLRLSPTTLLLPETYPLAASSATSELKLTVFGGTAPFVAFTTDTKRTRTTVTGSVIAISAGSGTLCSNTDVTTYTLAETGVTDPSQPATRAFDIIVTVVDALGASATAKLVIVDDNSNAVTTGNCR